MKKRIFFNSSLPRAGSTLLQNIIADNPDFYCTPTSGFLDLLLGAKGNYNNSSEFKAQDAELMKKGFIGFCHNGMHGYFNALTDKPYVLDKNRGWGIHLPFASEFMLAPKVVCMIRDVRAVYASMEKNFRKNPTEANHIQNPNQLVGTTLQKRINLWADGPPVGISMDRLKDAFDQGLDKRILFIRYEDLMDFPEQEIRRFYEYMEVPYYEGHSFETVTQHTHENDVIHGIYGDHKLRPKFERKPDDFEEVLGYEICQSIKNTYPWFFKKFGYV
jgi:sulfotransferase